MEHRISYTSGNPGTNQVKVRILDPDFKPVTIEPVYREYGFVVYTLPNPKPGNWSFDTFYYGPKTCNVTAGAIDPDQLASVAGWRNGSNATWALPPW